MIPYFDYRPLHRRLGSGIEQAISRVLDSGRLILGEEVAAFEKEFAAYVGCRYGVGLNSGTDALILALRALGVGCGDEVITVANAGVPPVAAIRAVGAMPRFVDIDRETLLLDATRLECACSERTRAVIAVHLYGQPVDLVATQRFVERHGLALIEDCAQAHGAHYRGRHVGGVGLVSCFSFYPTKNLGAYGDGGLCATNDAGLADTIRRQRMYGFDSSRHARIEGVNSRLDELQAAILRVKLVHLDEAVEERRRIAAAYTEALDGSSWSMPGLTPEGTHSYHLYVVRSPARERVIEALKAADIGFGLHYAEPVHLMQAYGFLGYRRGDLPTSERACNEVLSLPCYPGLEQDAIARIADVLRAVSPGSA